MKVQQPSITLKYDLLVAFVGPLSTNKNIKDTIKGGHLKTDIKWNNIALILLVLFIL